MTHWHGYFVLENLNLTSGQRDSVFSDCAALGEASSSNPSENKDRRDSLNSESAFFESKYVDTDITVASVKQMVADALGVGVGEISDAQTTTTYSTGNTTDVVTYIYSGTDQIILRVFGQFDSTRPQTCAESKQYMIDNDSLWNTQTPV